jgi:hypothetical protein
MGQFGNQPDFATNEVKVCTPSDTINTTTFLDSAVIYIGDNTTAGKDLKVIPAGAVGVQGVVSTITLGSGGSGYTAGVGQATTSASGLGTGLTLTTTVVGGAITAAAIVAAGTGYRQGDIVTVSGGTAGGFTINVVNAFPTAADAVTFKGLGTGGFLPVTVDYVLATETTVQQLISAK